MLEDRVAAVLGGLGHAGVAAGAEGDGVGPGHVGGAQGGHRLGHVLGIVAVVVADGHRRRGARRATMPATCPARSRGRPGGPRPGRRPGRRRSTASRSRSVAPRSAAASSDRASEKGDRSSTRGMTCAHGHVHPGPGRRRPGLDPARGPPPSSSQPSGPVKSTRRRAARKCLSERAGLLVDLAPGVVGDRGQLSHQMVHGSILLSCRRLPMPRLPSAAAAWASGLGVGGADPGEGVAVDVGEGLVAVGDLEHALLLVGPGAVGMHGTCIR